ncbi:MAG: Nramp family divalent metal transporter, partial [Pirellulales bacterium]
FWTVVYLLLDFGAIWPYLSANAAVPLVAAFLGHLPAEAGGEALAVRLTGYGIFAAAFVPLIFGGKIYNALEKVMVAKIVLVLGYLTFLGVMYVEWDVWTEIFTGFVRIGGLPVIDGQQLTWPQLMGAYFSDTGPVPLDFALLATFAAIAGSGGLTNTTFSSYAREKGWGMGPRVGAIPSAVGGAGIKLSHNGKVFPIDRESMRRWRGWRAVTLRDQLGIWIIGCILGMGIPSLVSLQFVAGRAVKGNALAAMTAQGVVDATGAPVFWFLTLLCGFLVLAPSQVSTMDGITRRWTDVIWTASGRLGHLEGGKVKYVYYTILSAYGLWGFVALTLIPNPLVILKMSGVLMNFALGFSALHTLAVNCTLLPRALRPGWLMRMSLVICATFFIGISVIGVPDLLTALGFGAN